MEKKKSKRGQPNLATELSKLKRALRTEASPERPGGGAGKAAASEKKALQKHYDEVRHRLSRELDVLDTLAEEAGLAFEAGVAFGGGVQPEPAAGVPFAAGTGGPPPPSKIDPGFSDFLSEVGKSMVEAQNQLDEETRKYLGGTAAQAMPTMFRIPRLNASLKFELQQKDDKTLNFIVFRDASQTSESRQHALEFEIVAAPPPPGFLPPLPAWRVLLGDERRNVISGLGLQEPVLVWELTGSNNRRLWFSAFCPTPAAGQPREATVKVFAPEKNLLFTQRVPESVGIPGSRAFVEYLYELAAKQQSLGS
jgi:hypothetical protein